MPSSKARMIVLASGRGSNFEAIAKAIQQNKIQNADIVLLICNVPAAKVLSTAQDLGIPFRVIPSRNQDRAAFNQRLLECLRSFNPDLICLAGYLLILGKEIVSAFPKRIINIHPSLLPDFKGLHAQKQALQFGAKETGCTVHFVNEHLDDGPIILQKKIRVHPGESVESLSQRLLPLEHEAYVEAINLVLKSLRMNPKPA